MLKQIIKHCYGGACPNMTNFHPDPKGSLAYGYFSCYQIFHPFSAR